MTDGINLSDLKNKKNEFSNKFSKERKKERKYTCIEHGKMTQISKENKKEKKNYASNKAK